jgi:hypothetical protein
LKTNAKLGKAESLKKSPKFHPGRICVHPGALSESSRDAVGDASPARRNRRDAQGEKNGKSYEGTKTKNRNKKTENKQTDYKGSGRTDCGTSEGWSTQEDCGCDVGMRHSLQPIKLLIQEIVVTTNHWNCTIN